MACIYCGCVNDYDPFCGCYCHKRNRKDNNLLKSDA